MAEGTTWKVCSICKTELPYSSKYYLCSVSTCRRKRTGLMFCSVGCFEAHMPMMRHRDAWAEEELAPSREQAEQEEAEERLSSDANRREPPVTTRRVVGTTGSSTAQDELADEVLVVASKLKRYIKAKANMNTSDTVLDPLSDHLRDLATRALRHAAADGRKTVMDRDVSAILKEFKSG